MVDIEQLFLDPFKERHKIYFNKRLDTIKSFLKHYDHALQTTPPKINVSAREIAIQDSQNRTKITIISLQDYFVI